MHQRNNFTKATKREAYKRSNGICECHLLAKRKIPGFDIEGCGCRLSSGNCFYEHIDPDALWGKNDIENCAALVKTCWRKKTDTFDRRVIAKANRQRDRDRGIERSYSRPMPGTIRSGIKTGFGKPPIDRRTGEPLFRRRGS